jgi:hypothetical protein
MNKTLFNKTLISYAVTAALSMTSGTSTADTITKLRLEDVGSNSAITAGSFSATLDGRSGAFSFSNINRVTYAGASLFTGDVPPGDILFQGAANATGTFSTGFLFSNTPFVPYTFGNNANGTISIDANGNYSADITTLDFGGNFGGGTNFNLPPDSGTLVINWAGRSTGGNLITNIQWRHDITTADDPSGQFNSFTARWILEGTLSVADAAPTIFPNVGASSATPGVPYTDPGAVCADVVDGLISGNIVTTYDPPGTTAPSNPQSDFEVIYNCQDNTAGLDAVEVRRPITVAAGPDVTPPAITLNACTAQVLIAPMLAREHNTVTVLTGATTSCMAAAMTITTVSSH